MWPSCLSQSKWIRALTTEIRDLFADRGGPVIMMQIENEYNVRTDDAYMGQLLRITSEMGMGTPWTFCENPPSGAHNESAYPQWIFTCNHESCLSSQSGHYLQRFRQLYPRTPAVFTEVGIGINPIVTLEKQLLNMIGHLVESG